MTIELYIGLYILSFGIGIFFGWAKDKIKDHKEYREANNSRWLSKDK